MDSKLILSIIALWAIIGIIYFLFNKKKSNSNSSKNNETLKEEIKNDIGAIEIIAPILLTHNQRTSQCEELFSISLEEVEKQLAQDEDEFLQNSVAELDFGQLDNMDFQSIENENQRNNEENELEMFKQENIMQEIRKCNVDYSMIMSWLNNQKAKERKRKKKSESDNIDAQQAEFDYLFKCDKELEQKIIMSTKDMYKYFQEKGLTEKGSDFTEINNNQGLIG